jgi:1,4-dihydroxy-6-naphthoate synthase
MKLTIGFSPCPNDTFIFDALVNGRINTGNITFEPVLEDVETLNRWALEGKLDITKLSFPAYFRTMSIYTLLQSGSALGNGVGPLLISKRNDVEDIDVNNCKIVLPGINTTANLLFSFAYPEAKNKDYKVFHEIEEAVINEEADLGVIIHENRFTYMQKGLHKVKDLGEYWEQKMHVPIPLGGIVIKRSLGNALYTNVNDWIQRSLSLAFEGLPHLSPYVACHAQAMSEDVMKQHIQLYVNAYSLSLGEKGVMAVSTLQKVFESFAMEQSE